MVELHEKGCCAMSAGRVADIYLIGRWAICEVGNGVKGWKREVKISRMKLCLICLALDVNCTRPYTQEYEYDC